MRALVSWIAWHYDFLEKTSSRPDPGGPSSELHRRFYDPAQHCIHWLLSPAEDRDERSLALFTHLRQNFPDHCIELKFFPLRNPFDFREIRQQAAQALDALHAAGHEIDILFSNGTTPMRTVWLVLHLEDNGYRTRLIQGKDRHMASGEPEFIEVPVDGSLFSYRLHIGQAAPPSSSIMTPALVPLYEQAARVADFPDVSCLIEGESGVGKERVARYIHAHSVRRRKPFRAINCGAFRNEELMESRLFGHLKGSFTGADRDRKGLFEEAQGGTLFLDEIGDISPYLQASLLRVLQERVITPVGSSEERKVDVRVLAATHRNLWEECRAGRFRWDLYYRLVQTRLQVPAFRDYPREERIAFIEGMMAQGAANLKQKPLEISPLALEKLLAHPFPGNIRELENLITRAFVFAGPSRRLLPADLPAELHQAQPESLSLEAAKRRHIEQVLRLCGGNMAQACRLLGIARNTLKAHLVQEPGSGPAGED